MNFSEERNAGLTAETVIAGASYPEKEGKKERKSE